MAEVNKQLVGKTIIRQYLFDKGTLMKRLGMVGDSVNDMIINSEGGIEFSTQEELKKPFNVDD